LPTAEITNLFILDGDFHSDKILSGIFLLSDYGHFKRSVTTIETGKSRVEVILIILVKRENKNK